MTLAEMKERMTVGEMHVWYAYTKEHGPLSMPLRIDAAIARAVLPFMKRGATMKDFMPWPKRQQVALTTDEAKAFIRGKR